jgi:hypothetical protein
MPLSEDMRFGLRSIARVARAIGIGTNAAVFAIANAVLFTGMPFVSNRILYLSTRNPARSQDVTAVSYAGFRDWRAQTKAFEGLGASRNPSASARRRLG